MEIEFALQTLETMKTLNFELSDRAMPAMRRPPPDCNFPMSYGTTWTNTGLSLSPSAWRNPTRS